MRRRSFLAALAAAPALAVTARADEMPDNGWREAMARLTGGRTPQPGRVRLQLPETAENGNSVALTVAVDSRMRGDDRVAKLHLVSEGNPFPHMATFRFGAGAGRAEVVTRIKLARTQRVFAVAEFADGSLWSDVRRVNVAFAACGDGS